MSIRLWFFKLITSMHVLLTLQTPIVYKKDISSHTLTVCRGQMRSIACPDLKLLHVYNAFYGKLSGHDCQDPVTQLRDQMPTCFSKDAPKIIREVCQGQQSCDLYAEDSLYDDPCPTVTKYLFVSFTCQGKSQLPERLKMFEQQQQQQQRQPVLPIKQPFIETFVQLRHDFAEIPKRMSAVVCTGQTGSIYCPELKILRIKSAFYGKQEGRDCTGKQTRDTIPSCYARDTIATIKDMCDGQQSCDLFSEADLYGRTLCDPKVQKYLQVEYTCEGHSDLQEKLNGNDKVPYAPLNYQPPQQRSSQSLYLRSTLPYPVMQAQSNYNPWQQWKNRMEQNSWRRTQSWPNTQETTQWSQTIPNQPAVTQQKSSPATEWSGSEQTSSNPDRDSSSVRDYFGYRHSQCEQCNGDCRNFLCYGCGGCQEPPPEQQTYYYPYQRQDAAYHDAFQGNEMALSGLVIWPVPKVPMPAHEQKKQHRSNVAKEDEDDDEDDSDDDNSDGSIRQNNKPNNKTKREVVSY